MDNIILERLKLNQQDQFGNTALHLACIKVHTYVRMLYKFLTVHNYVMLATEWLRVCTTYIYTLK